MTNEIFLKDSVNLIKGIGSKKLLYLEKLGIVTIEDLLNHFPYKYKDKRNVVFSGKLIDGGKYLVSGRLIKISTRSYGSGRTLVECILDDDAGKFGVSFFNMPYIKQTLSIGKKYSVYGTVRIRNGYKQFSNPEISEFNSSKDTRGILPVYKCTSGITNNDFSKWVKTALEASDVSYDWIDSNIVNEEQLCDREFVYRNIHFPESESHYKAARYRMIFEELLMYQLEIRLNVKDINKNVDAGIEDADINDYIEKLPFSLTEGQRKCIKEIEHDLVSPKPMNRLIQGDVGCGKTVVAEAAMFKCVKAGYQAAMMAPTEILARQHFEKISEEFAPFGIKTVLLVSGISKKERQDILNEIKTGSADVVVGTHAIIQEDVEFANLGIVITDEQHRFGVNQRKSLAHKGASVNVCVMSATPIPRTLAATVYGDMDFSVIPEKPSNRKEIITKAVYPESRDRAYIAVLNELKAGHQAYVVAPSIDSDDDNLTSVEQLYSELSEKFKDYNIALIHGRLDAETKGRIMNDFLNGKIDILVSTTVIEVGIDVPDATIIVLENSDRYGLAQMHQLRGRVGRSDFQSYCYLVNYSNSESAVERAKAMVNLSSGFDISEEDFLLRGPGDISGTMQSGNYQSHIIDLCKYKDILDKAVFWADEIMKSGGKTDLTYVRNHMLNNYAEDNSNII